ncbi:MAG: ABC transporter permease [Chloroflexi bacterium]|nr:ABC transporter permease [Chloroflexota bacterium]
MGTYIVRRILISIPVLFGITVLAFGALSLAPGDPLTSRIDPEILAQMSTEQVEAARRALGLDQPVPVRYVIWLGDVVQGDFGYSVVNKLPVTQEVLVRLGPTLILMTVALVVGTTAGILFGIVAAVRQYGVVDYLVTAFSTSFIAIPTFVTGLVLIYIFGAALKILPTTGMITLGKPFSLGDLAAHMVMPVVLLSIQLSAPLARYTRASMLEVLNTEYMTTSRSKGLRGRIVLLRHGFRNALIPIITIVGLTLPDLVAGAVITESLFGWPGMGQLAVKAATGRDAALMMGVILVVATGVLVSNLITDILYGVVDPRVRLGARA